MHRCPFFASVADKVNQWVGNLFYRRVSPAEITAMGYVEMKYWNEWHELMVREEQKAGK